MLEKFEEQNTNEAKEQFGEEQIQIKVLCDLIDRVTGAWDYSIANKADGYSIEEMEKIKASRDGIEAAFDMLLFEICQYVVGRKN